MIITRFAPSPTGNLHLGNARVAVLCYCLTRQNGGRFILRIDDTDQARSEDRFVTDIKADMNWLGMAYNDIVFQSQRQDIYAKAIQELKNQSRLYPCYETPEELATKREAQRRQGLPPRYDRAALSLSNAQKKQLEAEGRTPHWRFLLRDEVVAWDDLNHDLLSCDPCHMSDPVLVRADGTPFFLLTGAVDDLNLHMTHILRGDDHIANTAVQIQIIDALGAKQGIHWGHLPLLKGPQGEPLSKRLDSLSLKKLRQEGYTPEAVRDFLISLGTAEDNKIYDSWNDASRAFNLKKYGKSSPPISLETLTHINKTKIAACPPGQLKQYLENQGKAGFSEAFLSAVRENIEKWPDLLTWHTVCYGEIQATLADDLAYIKEALTHLPPEPWDEETWKVWTCTLKKQTGRTGRILYHPLRQALTGYDYGPPMPKLLPIIGHTRAKMRLQRALS